MDHELVSLNRYDGTPRHVWIGEANETGGDWVATIRFGKGMKPDLQVREHLARLNGSERLRDLKVVVGTDAMWRKHACYAQPPAPVPAQ